MKRVLRFLLFILAMVTGSLLGIIFLSGFELAKMCFFGVACILLGEVFHIIDKRINNEKGPN